MAAPAFDYPHLEDALYRLYREFFNRAEKKRRWSLQADIPWDRCNPSVDPAIADVVESFCAVELYLPDYVSNAMRGFRPSRACTWFYANWGYEESKHSLALSDWLLRSRTRTQEQVADLEKSVFAWDWKVPHGSAIGMLCYAMVQELATGLTYRNLKRHVGPDDDAALATLLGYLGVDEQAHHHFFQGAVQLCLEHHRAETLRQLRGVLHNFAMPAIYEMVDGRRRVEAIKSLGLFDGRLYFTKVYEPILAMLGVTRPELRRAA